MTIKLNRESSLVILMAVMILIGLFYYGNRSLVKPLQEEATNLTKKVETHQSLVEEYPPSEKELEEYQLRYSEAESILPLGVQANESLVTLESLADKAKVSIVSVSRVLDQEPLEEESEDFAKDTYTAELTAASPADFRKMIDLLMEEERVWDMSSFSYSKSGEKEYLASLDYELYYRMKNKE